ncbi:Uma2 family endonuclease [Synechocystis sp. FACHB-383]|nr:Uma2 family endonuclease [Synechocystis sp. FACHB-383]
MGQTVTDKNLTLEEFSQLPEGEVNYEFQDGTAIAKMSPKRIHSCLQRALLFLLSDWGNREGCALPGEAYPEWAICLQKDEQDWAPVPDVTYISDGKLAPFNLENDLCPVAPELVVEIVSPGQSFEVMAKKAVDYLAAGVERVWIIGDAEGTLRARHRSLTIFAPDRPPITYQGDRLVEDDLLPQLSFTVNELFAKAKVEIKNQPQTFVIQGLI